MRIKKLFPEGYGNFYQREIDGFSKGLNIVYGENEAGKTTLLDFIRMTFFGYPDKRSKTNRRPPLKGGNHGGKIIFETSDGSVYDLHRSGGNNGISLFDHQSKTTQSEESSFSRLTGNAGADLYNNIYAITLDELVSLSALNESGMQDRIYSMGMGLAGMDFGAFESGLESEAEEYYKKRGKTQTFVELAREIDALQKKKNEYIRNVATFDKLNLEVKELLEKKEGMTKAKNTLESERRKLDNFIKIYPDFIAYYHLQEKKAGTEGREIVSEEYFNRYVEKKSKRESLKEELEEIDHEILGLRKGLQKLKIDPDLEKQLPQLDYLKSHIELYRQKCTAHSNLLLEFNRMEAETEELLKRLGPEYNQSEIIALQGIHKIKTRALEFKEELNSLYSGKTSHEKELEGVEMEIGNLEEERRQWCESLADSVVFNDQERSHASEKLDELRVQFESMMEHIQSRNSGSNFSEKYLVFGLAAIMCITGAFLFQVAWMAAAILFLSGILAVVFAFWRDRKTESKKTPNRYSPKELRMQMTELEKNIEHFDKCTEKINEIGRQIELKKKHRETVRDKCLNTDNKLEETTRDWKIFLKESGLSADVGVSEFLNALPELEKIRELDIRQKKILEEKTVIKSQIREFEGRVEEMAPDKAEGQSTEIAAVNLIEQMNECSEQIQKRDALGNQLQDRERKRNLKSEQSVKVEGEMNALMKKINAADENDFFAFFESQKQHLKDLEEMDRLVEKMEAVAGPGKAEAASGFLASHPLDELEARVESLQSKTDALGNEIEKTDREIGSLNNEIRKMLEKGDGQKINTELEGLHSQLREAFENWAGLQIAGRIVRECKKKYEENRQPQVIKNSQGIFNKITNGAYSGIQVSLGDSEVHIIDSGGGRKTVSELSRGTREQLLLSMRMGLIEEYETHTEPLPVILDDIMVNFDRARAEKTAEVLSSFAADRQVILFTCHRYTLDLFAPFNPNRIDW
nr:AAA family ATPase [Saprospiraceae bacterium]